MSASIGKPKSQTTFEYMVLYLVLLTWGDRYADQGFAVMGDNISSLACATSLKGKGALSQISREIAWRKVRHRWRFSVAHVPSEQNTLADALSRTSSPDSAEHRSFPHAELKGARRMSLPSCDQWWPASV